MLILILDSLGSTELLFILVMALIFFGPRKLPQISRTLGKNLAEFRKASEDFKRTWEREVALESSAMDHDVHGVASPRDNTTLDVEADNGSHQRHVAGSPMQDAVPRTPTAAVPGAAAESLANPEAVDPSSRAEPLRKRDWL